GVVRRSRLPERSSEALLGLLRCVGVECRRRRTRRLLRGELRRQVAQLEHRVLGLLLRRRRRRARVAAHREERADADREHRDDDQDDDAGMDLLRARRRWTRRQWCAVTRRRRRRWWRRWWRRRWWHGRLRWEVFVHDSRFPMRVTEYEARCAGIRG